MKEIYAINSEWEQTILKAADARGNAKSPQALESAQRSIAATERRLVERSMELARRQPGSAAGLIALKMVACRTAKTEDGKKAAEAVVKRAASADLGVLAQALAFPTNVSEDPVHAVVPIILDRVKKDPSHPQSPSLLSSIVCGSVDREAAKPPAEFVEAAELIVKRYPASPDVRNFCEVLGYLGSGPNWAGQFEKHLRTILDKNSHREVRAAASFALASVVARAGEGRQREAEELYEEAIKKFDGSSGGEHYFYANIEKMANDRAKQLLAELRLLGRPAPEINGVDLDGRGMKLSDFRGKVVLLSFWATWCGPCMAMVPHERELLKRWAGKPFVIVGVNGDEDQKAARAAVAEKGMTWRSFQSGLGPQSIARDWHVWGWPTFYLIDPKGIIRKRWQDTGPEELDHAIDQLVGVPSESATAK
jgi:thiol-disulfide isomerase/thioredoxin